MFNNLLLYKAACQLAFRFHYTNIKWLTSYILLWIMIIADNDHLYVNVLHKLEKKKVVLLKIPVLAIEF